MAANCGPAAGLLVFLVSAALLALVGLVVEAGVVETQTVVAAALSSFNSLYRSAPAVGSRDSGRTVGISEKGSLDMAQWNFLIDWVMLAVAKLESRQSNQNCGESA